MQAAAIELPASKRCTIVVVSGSALRRQYAALRLQAAFPDLVTAWLCAPTPAPPVVRPEGRLARVKSVLRQVLSGPQRGAPSLADVEDRFLGPDVKRLTAHCRIRAIEIDEAGSADTFAMVEALQPYFVVFVGAGANWERTLRGCARGLALSQRDGWVSDQAGVDPIQYALYHRDLTAIGSMIQITPGGDGPMGILWRATACLAIDDDLQTCLVRCAALGADLMCDAVAELMAERRARPVAASSADGFAIAAVPPDIAIDVQGLLAGGFIPQAVARYQTF